MHGQLCGRHCGDGLLYDGVEQCDDGNIINGDGCGVIVQHALQRILTAMITHLSNSQAILVCYNLRSRSNTGCNGPRATNRRHGSLLSLYGNSGDVFQFRVGQRNDLIYFEMTMRRMDRMVLFLIISGITSQRRGKSAQMDTATYSLSMAKRSMHKTTMVRSHSDLKILSFWALTPQAQAPFTSRVTFGN